METHADQLFLQKSQPPGKEKHCILAGNVAVLSLLALIITLEINPYRISHQRTCK